MRKESKMKILGVALLVLFVTGAGVLGCQSNTSKVEEAKEEVEDANHELNKVQEEAKTANQKAASIEDWRIFKEETNLKIKQNEVRIAELKEKMQGPGKTLDSFYQKRIEKLERNNNVMKVRLETYEKEQSDWESFKREYNHDMDELSRALSNFSNDDKK